MNTIVKIGNKKYTIHVDEYWFKNNRIPIKRKRPIYEIMEVWSEKPLAGRVIFKSYNLNEVKKRLKRMQEMYKKLMVK